MSGSASPLGGYVAGFPGGTVTSFSIDGFPGQPDTTGLPAGTSNGLFVSIPSGRPVVLQVVTSAPPTEPFNIASINQSQTGYGPVFPCPFADFPIPASTKESDGLGIAVADVNGDGTPELIFPAPGPGVLSLDQVAVTQPPAGVKSTVALIRPERVRATKAGKISVQLRTTAAGRALLVRSGGFSARLKAVFKPKAGASTSQTIPVSFSTR
ncbi:MAG: VCBS repeat-containing protein [Actinomycetota bacterium]|nr:VCBS repeat-containing protein [Actinomycetota bacterium]